MSNPRHQDQTSGHRYALKRLSSYMDGQLPDSERARVYAHLKTCHDCREELRTLSWTKGLAQQIPVMPVPRSFIVRQADLEARHIAQPRPLLVPALARLQTAAAIVALLLVVVIAGDVLVGGRLPGGQSARTLPMKAPAPASATLAIEQALEMMPDASPAEPTDPAPDTLEIMAMAVATETLTVATKEGMGAPKLSRSPTAQAIDEPSPTLPPDPTQTPTKAGHSADVTSTQSTPEPTATASPTKLAPHTPTTEPTPVPTPTYTIAPTAAPTDTPVVEPQPLSEIYGESNLQQETEDEERGPPPEGTYLAGQREPGQVWRTIQIGLGVVLVGLLIAILWLRRWGRLG